MWYGDIISLITSPDLQKELFPAKVVFIFFTIFFFAGIIYFIFTSSFLRYQFIIDMKGFFKLESAGLKKFIRQWKKIRKIVETGGEYEYKLAIIEAEELFKDVLVDRGFTGKNFEEMIKKVEEIQLPNIDEILETHELRNSVVRDPNYKISKDEVTKFLGVYERGIKSIESF